MDQNSPRGHTEKFRLPLLSFWFAGLMPNAMYGNLIFRVDSSFNLHRAGPSLLLVHELPPNGSSGGLAFADSRVTYDELKERTKQYLIYNDFIAGHSPVH